MVLKCLKHAYQCLPAENSKRLSVFCLGRRGSLERAVSCGPPVSCRCHQWLQCAKSNAVDLQYWGWCIPPFSGEIAGGLQYVICLPSMIKICKYVYHPWLNHSYWYLGNTYEYHDSLVNHPWIGIASPHDMTRGSLSLGGGSQLSSRPFHFARWHPSWASVAPGSGWMSQAGHQWFGWFGGPCGAAGHLRASGIEVTQMDQWSFRNLGGNIDD